MGSVLLSLLGVGKFIRSHWQWFAVAVAVGLLWFAWARHEKSVWNEGYNVGWAQQHRELLIERAGHDITRASLAQALIAIADQNKAIADIKAKADAKIAASGVAIAAAKKETAKAEDVAKALDRSASVVGKKDALCLPSETFLQHSGEL